MKDMKETLRYKNMVANLKNRPPYIKEAALLREIAGGKQWRMDAVIEAISAKPKDWGSVKISRVLEQAAMFGRLATMEQVCKTLGYEGRVPNPAMDAFHTAALHGHFRVADYLIDKCGAHPNSASRFDVRPALPQAAIEGNYKKVDYLLRRGGDASWALSSAVSGGASLGMVRHLLAKGADVNSGEHDIFRTAMQAGRMEMAAFLLKNGAKPEAVDVHVQADILYYALSAPMALFEKLLDRGMKPNDRHLLEVIAKGDMAVAELLVAKGGLSVHGADGKEYALLAALNSQKPAEAFQFCLRHGADAEKALETLNRDPDLYKYGARATVEKRLNNYVGMLRLQRLARKPPTP